MHSNCGLKTTGKIQSLLRITVASQTAEQAAANDHVGCSK